MKLERHRDQKGALGKTWSNKDRKKEVIIISGINSRSFSNFLIVSFFYCIVVKYFISYITFILRYEAWSELFHVTADAAS